MSAWIQQNGQDKLKISKGIPHTKTQWVLMEKQLNSSGHFSRIFDIVCSSRDPERLGGEEHPTSEFQRLDDFLSMFKDSLYKSDDQNCISNDEKVKNDGMGFLPGHWTLMGPRSEKRWYGDTHGGRWDRTVNKMVQQLKEIVHPFVTATSA